ncbi:MAG: hypothetical protein ACI8UO_004813 [Verrucomicrobiales bacterium]|jgi:hypothetical protein
MARDCAERSANELRTGSPNPARRQAAFHQAGVLRLIGSATGAETLIDFNGSARQEIRFRISE